MTSTFKSTFTPNIGTTPSVIYGPVASATQAVAFGMGAANTNQFPITADFYVNFTIPTLLTATVTAIPDVLTLTVSNVNNISAGTIISPSQTPNNLQTVSTASGNTITFVAPNTSAPWGTPLNTPTNTTIYAWAPATNTYLLKAATIPVGGSLVVLGADRKLALQTGAIIYGVASAATSMDVSCSILELT